MVDQSPSWLNEQFLANSLEHPGVVVLSFSVSQAVAAGNNYTSFLYRVLVKYKVRQSSDELSISLIVKAPIVEGIFKDLAETVDFYGTETRLYNKLLPLMKKKFNFEFGPKSFKCGIKDVLILEDMVEKGFVMRNKHEQLDLPHCRVVVKTLAEFHATSVACYHEDPKLIETVGNERFFVPDGVNAEGFRFMIEFTIKQLADVVKDLGAKISTVDFIRGRVDGLWDSYIDLCTKKENGLNVLNHGDCWTNNLLFKYCDDDIDVRLIDFQYTRLSSPVLDLIFFIWTSAREEVREHNQEELYAIYLQSLNETLEKLGCEERFTDKELRAGIRSAVDWILKIVGFDLPLMLCPAENAFTFDNYTKEDFQNLSNNLEIQKVYRGRYYRAILPGVVRDFEAWLNCM